MNAPILYLWFLIWLLNLHPSNLIVLGSEPASSKYLILPPILFIKNVSIKVKLFMPALLDWTYFKLKRRQCCSRCTDKKWAYDLPQFFSHWWIVHVCLTLLDIFLCDWFRSLLVIFFSFIKKVNTYNLIILKYFFLLYFFFYVCAWMKFI